MSMTSLDQEILESIENIEETILECQIENMFTAFELYQKQLTILEYADDVPDELFFSEFAIFTEADKNSEESEHNVKGFFNTKFGDETGKNKLFGRTTKDGKKEHVIIGLLALLPRLFSGLFNLIFKKNAEDEVKNIEQSSEKLKQAIEKNPENIKVEADVDKESAKIIIASNDNINPSNEPKNQNSDEKQSVNNDNTTSSNEPKNQNSDEKQSVNNDNINPSNEPKNQNSDEKQSVNKKKKKFKMKKIVDAVKDNNVKECNAEINDLFSMFDDVDDSDIVNEIYELAEQTSRVNGSKHSSGVQSSVKQDNSFINVAKNKIIQEMSKKLTLGFTNRIDSELRSSMLKFLNDKMEKGKFIDVNNNEIVDVIKKTLRQSGFKLSNKVDEEIKTMVEGIIDDGNSSPKAIVDNTMNQLQERGIFVKSISDEISNAIESVLNHNGKFEETGIVNEDIANAIYEAINGNNIFDTNVKDEIAEIIGKILSGENIGDSENHDDRIFVDTTFSETVVRKTEIGVTKRMESLLQNSNNEMTTSDIIKNTRKCIDDMINTDPDLKDIKGVRKSAFEIRILSRIIKNILGMKKSISNFAEKIKNKNDEKKSEQRALATKDLRKSLGNITQDGSDTVVVNEDNSRIITIEIPMILLAFEEMQETISIVSKFTTLINKKIIPNIKKYTEILQKKMFSRKYDTKAAGKLQYDVSKDVKELDSIANEIRSSVDSISFAKTKHENNIKSILKSVDGSKENTKNFVTLIANRCKHVEKLMADMRKTNDDLNKAIGNYATRDSLIYYAEFFNAKSKVSQDNFKKYDITVGEDRYADILKANRDDFFDRVIKPITTKATECAGLLREENKRLTNDSKKGAFKDFGDSLKRAQKLGLI